MGSYVAGKTETSSSGPAYPDPGGANRWRWITGAAMAGLVRAATFLGSGCRGQQTSACRRARKEGRRSASPTKPSHDDTSSDDTNRDLV